MSTKPTLLLLPNLLGEHRHHEIFLPASVDRAVESLDGLISESEQGGRRYLSRFKTKKPPHETPIALLNEHTGKNDLDFLLEPIRKGERWGLLSDAGLPCIADPGALLVRRARELGIAIQAFVGPSSILMALMLSGLSGQHFTFHGYLPKEATERRMAIQNLDRIAKTEGYTQIFMETPYRNQQMLETLVESLSSQSILCVAWDLTLPTQGILSQPLPLWKKSPLPNLNKKNAIFLVAYAPYPH
jgi:16S rRNA (cytidine1402-2'-O)-methyltransferase